MMKLWKRVSGNRLIQLAALALAFLGLAGALVFFPTAWNPYVRVPGSTIALPLECVASEFHLRLRSRHLKLQRAELVVRDLSGKIKAERFTLDLQNFPADDAVHLALSQGYQRSALDYLARHTTSGSNISAIFEFARVPQIDLDGVLVLPSAQYTNDSCKRQYFEPKLLSSALSKGDAKLMRYRRPQDVIGDGILLANEFVGSIVLAGMIVISCWLLWATSAGFIQAYIAREKNLNSLLLRGRKSAMERGLAVTDAEIVRNRFHLIERRFIFWRVVGPALGFILTISSLVEGLHPSKQGGQDSFSLISALQLALVATFVGLWIRVLAELAIRLHRTAAERRLAHISATAPGRAINED